MAIFMHESARKWNFYIKSIINKTKSDVYDVYFGEQTGLCESSVF